MPNITKPNDLSNVWAATGDIVAPAADYVANGWKAIIPPREYFNWLDNRQDRFNAHVNQHGVPVWDANTEYQANISYTKGSDGIIYRAANTNSNVNPVGDSTGAWYPFSAAGSLIRTTIYKRVNGVQMVSVNGGTFSATNATNFTPTPFTRQMRIRSQGAGGGGGGTATTGPSTLSAAGGGGAGAYAEGFFPPTSAAVNVGVGGVGGTPNTVGNAGSGTASTFGSIVSAPGGAGSQNQTVAQSAAGIFGGTGPSGTPTGGNLLAIQGGAGTYGMNFAGVSASVIGGKGGDSLFGQGPSGSNNTAPGTTSTNFGTGGSGSAVTVSGAGQRGGDGATGVVIVEEYA